MEPLPRTTMFTTARSRLGWPVERREPCQMTEYLTIQQVADVIHAEHRVVRKAIRRGELRASLVGGRYLITEIAVEEWIESRAVRPTGPPVRRERRPARPRPATEGQRSVARLRAMESGH